MDNTGKRFLKSRRRTSSNIDNVKESNNFDYEVTNEEALNLFEQGKTPHDLMEMGVPKATAYKWHKDWREEKGKLEEMSEGEKTALLFSLFKKGKSLVDVVIESRLPYEEVSEALDGYEEAAEVVVLRQEDTARWVNRFKSLNKMVELLMGDIERGNQRLKEFQAKAAQLDESFKALEELMKQRNPILILRDIMEMAKCPKCGKEGLNFSLKCSNCNAYYLWG